MDAAPCQVMQELPFSAASTLLVICCATVPTERLIVTPTLPKACLLGSCCDSLAMLAGGRPGFNQLSSCKASSIKIALPFNIIGRMV